MKNSRVKNTKLLLMLLAISAAAVGSAAASALDPNQEGGAYRGGAGAPGSPRTQWRTRPPVLQSFEQAVAGLPQHSWQQPGYATPVYKEDGKAAAEGYSQQFKSSLERMINNWLVMAVFSPPLLKTYETNEITRLLKKNAKTPQEREVVLSLDTFVTILRKAINKTGKEEDEKDAVEEITKCREFLGMVATTYGDHTNIPLRTHNSCDAIHDAINAKFTDDAKPVSGSQRGTRTVRRQASSRSLPSATFAGSPGLHQGFEASESDDDDDEAASTAQSPHPRPQYYEVGKTAAAEYSQDFKSSLERMINNWLVKAVVSPRLLKTYETNDIPRLLNKNAKNRYEKEVVAEIGTLVTSLREARNITGKNDGDDGRDKDAAIDNCRKFLEIVQYIYGGHENIPPRILESCVAIKNALEKEFPPRHGYTESPLLPRSASSTYLDSPRAPQGHEAPGGYSPQYEGMSPAAPAAAAEERTWDCPNCNMRNWDHESECNSCQQQKP
jgi:hypothetical protein